MLRLIVSKGAKHGCRTVAPVTIIPFRFFVVGLNDKEWIDGVEPLVQN